MFILGAFLLVLLIAGGGSRGDLSGQVVVRIAAWIALIAVILTGTPVRLGRVRAVSLLLGGALLLAFAQLILLPPEIWQMLPGRALLADAARLSGQTQPWRPWSIVPDATANAVASLIVPTTTLVLLAATTEHDRRFVPGVLVGLGVLSALVGMLQFSGSGVFNPLVNADPGIVSGLFANRNHFALFMAIECVVTPVWAFQNGQRSGWRAPTALALILVYALLILASGSRAGILVGILGIAAALILVRDSISRKLSQYSRWVRWTLSIGMVSLIGTVVLASVFAGRAVSIDRAASMETDLDIRRLALPTEWSMLKQYWPAGSGLGGFNPIFRIHEPFTLLKPTYFNHAHNDFLEIVLDAGLPGLLLLVAGVGWWGWASVSGWRGSERGASDARLGSTMLLLILVASAFDYPARTPLIMAVGVLAAVWLSSRKDLQRGSALPTVGEHL